MPSKAGTAVLLNMIFAMGAFDAAKEDKSDDGHSYYEKAREALHSDMLEDGTLELVQGLAIMGNYLQRSNRPNAGFVCLGLAIRMAVALGLHDPSTSARLSPFDQESRKRVWWCLITNETGCSVTFGRPNGVGAALSGPMPLPLNIDDEHLTVSSEMLPESVDTETKHSALLIQARVARAMATVHDRILLSYPAPTLEQINGWDKRIADAIARLPEPLQHAQSGRYRFARASQLWRTRDFRAILYRPILLAAAWDSSSQSELPRQVREAIE